MSEGAECIYGTYTHLLHGCFVQVRAGCMRGRCMEMGGRCMELGCGSPVRASRVGPCHSPLSMSPLIKGDGSILVLYKDTLAHCRRQDLRHHHRKLERGDEITRVQLRDSVRVLESHAAAYCALLAEPRALAEPCILSMTREERQTLANCMAVWFANERVAGATQGQPIASNWT